MIPRLDARILLLAVIALVLNATDSDSDPLTLAEYVTHCPKIFVR